MLHFNAIVDEGRQGDKACFKSLVCQEHQAERKTSVLSVPGACPEFFPESCSPDSLQGSVCLLAFLSGDRNAYTSSCVCCLGSFVLTDFRSITLTLKNKNLKFQDFLSPFSTLIYDNPASKIETFFGSNLHTHLIIEASFFPLTKNIVNIGAKQKILGELPIVGIENQTLAHFRHFRHFRHFKHSVPLHQLALRYPPYARHPTNKFVRNYKLFMQNKAKVKSAKINVSSFLTSKYVLTGHLVIQTTKPIQSQFKPIKANPKPICRKGKY